MIPKILHYCWFGHGQMDATSKMCMESWKKFCPDYEIKLWNEDNFDISQNPFVQEAYEEKKWAFVTDYVRLYVLYHFGGIYLDADIELLKNLDDLLPLDGVVTSYQDCTIPAAIMLSEKRNPWIKALLDYYNDRHFRQADGTLDIVENDKIITAMSIRDFGFKMGQDHIDFGNVHLFPSSYFGPYKKTNKKIIDPIKLKENFQIDPKHTYAIHHGIGSWDHRTKTPIGKFKALIFKTARRVLSERVYLSVKWFFMKRQLGL